MNEYDLVDLRYEVQVNKGSGGALRKRNELLDTDIKNLINKSR